jgi:alkanesulfonate monooxygenase SsuD/methylene tetrahydromethanopterin reductase-like flavin-dependent oxidoreductase (luciferase family)
MNMPWDRRGKRSDEHIELLRTLWTAPGKHVEFHGEFWDIPPMDPEPLPVQRPIPIVVGGHSEPAIDRAARLGDGWIAGHMKPERLAGLLDQLRTAAQRHDRDPGSLSVYAETRGTTIDDVRPFEELGVDSLQVPVKTVDELKRFADEVLPRVGA